MFSFSIAELVVILAIVLVVFGPAKLPEISRTLGKSIRDFKSTTSGIKEEIHKTVLLDAYPGKDSGK